MTQAEIESSVAAEDHAKSLRPNGSGKHSS
jgi:hypothetical protein